MIFEVDFILNAVKPLRLINLGLALTFNWTYIFLFVNYLMSSDFDFAFENKPKPTGDLINDWINLGIAAIFITVTPNFFMNVIIVLKEIQFYLFTVSNEYVFIDRQDIENTFKLFINMTSPLYWVELLY